MNLDKNSEEMKTIVETFVIEETAELIYDNDQLEKWNSIVSELGLKGQEALVKPEKSPIPFMHMNSVTEAICRELCPREVTIEKYDKTPIPLEILELVTLSKREQYFTEIQIWYDDKSPDPFCVGMNAMYYTYDNNSQRTKDFKTREEAQAIAKSGWNVYTTDATYYLIGKWADVKRSFAELKVMARERFLEREKASIEDMIARCKRDLDDLEKRANNMFN